MASSRVAAARALYVYGIVRAGAPLRLDVAGMDERGPVHAIELQGLAAVVSEVPSGTPDPSRANLLAHERVNGAVLRERTVIPMSFGTLFRSRADVEELLRSAHDTFADVLEKLQDKLEFGLKVFHRADLGLQADEALAQQRVAEILQRLRDACVASRCNPTIGDRMILNAAFLVERRREAAFDQRLQAIAGEHDDLTFRYSGPWPPYNFVAIRLKREPVV